MKRKIASKSWYAAFTFTDLLAVLAALFLAACLALPSLAGARSQTKLAQCSENLRRLCLASQNYAHDNADRLPVNGGGNWLWDATASVIDPLQQAGVKRENFYCPDAPSQNSDLLWNFNGFWRVLGYSLTFPGAPTLIASHSNPTLTPQPQSIGLVIIQAQAPAQRALVADATISQPGQSSTNLATKLTYNYAQIPGFLTHHSPHLIGRLPAGGNLGMLDGHVEWRDFSGMIPRTSSGSAPVFWW